MTDYEEDIYRDWYAQVGFQLKKFYPDLDVECWTPEREYKKERVNFRKGIKFRMFPTDFSLRHSMELCSSMVRALREEEKQAKKRGEKLIMHIHEYHSWIAYHLICSVNKKITRIICQHHGGRSPLGNLKKYNRLFLFLPVIVLMQFSENLFFKKADVFYSLSDSEISYVQKLAKKSIVRFQTMGIEDEYFKKYNKEKARNKLGFDKNKKYVLFLGRLKTTKGIPELLRAAKKLENEKIEFLLIGGGVDSGKYSDFVEKNQIKNVRLPGPVYGELKLDYLSASDFLILPSHTEGAPVVIMEALAKNLPIIATDVGGIRKMIKNKKQGIIIKAKSEKDMIKAVKEILKWKKRDVKKAGERYRWKKIIESTLKDYSFLQKK
jgi:glycosyltransferase involved in cell wall biosynthesis